MDAATAGRERVAGPGRHRNLAVEDLTWLGLLVAGVVGAFVIRWVAPHIYEIYPEPDYPFFPEWLYLVKPERLEATRVLLALALPVVLTAVVISFGSRAEPRRSLDGLILAVQVVAVALLVWAALGQVHVLPGTDPGYFEPLLISVPVAEAGAAIGLALTALLLSDIPERVSLAARLGALPRNSAIPVLIAVGATALWLLPAVIPERLIFASGPTATGHVSVHAADYFAVVNGRTPLVDYVGVYAHMLPLALAPLLGAFDSSMTAFSIAMCSLSLLALLAIYGVFWIVTRSAWFGLALFIPYLALSLIPWETIGAVWDYTANYYAVLPDRYFGPFLLALLCAARLRGARVPLWLLFGAGGLVALNNLEFGLPAVIAAAAAIALTADRSPPLLPRLARGSAAAVLGLLAAVALASVVILLRSGQFPDLRLLGYYSEVFVRGAYGLEPMPARGLHWALYATYIATLLIAAGRFVRGGGNRAATGMLWYAGVLGLGTAAYFGGRSLPFQLISLFPIWALGLALVAWTAAGSLRASRGDRARVRRLMIPALAAMVGFGVMTAAIIRFPVPWEQVDRIRAPGPFPEGGTDPAEAFVERRTRPGERILLFGLIYDHRIADRAGVVNVSPWNNVFYIYGEREMDRALDALEDEGGDQVFEKASYLDITDLPSARAMIRARGYRPVERDEASGLTLWERPSSQF